MCDSGAFRSKETEWLRKNKEEYAGQWVVIEGEELIAVGWNAVAVYGEAKAKGIKVPFIVQVEKKDALPFGGW